MSYDGTVIVDDQPAGDVLQYTGDWTHLYSLANAVNDTLSYTARAGGIVVFKFNGTGVGVVGATAPVSNGTEPPISSYVLDDGSPVVYTAPSNITATVFSQTFFLQQSLAPSEHTLVINVTRASDAAPFLLDYIGYIPVSNITNTTSTPSYGIPSSSAPPSASTSAASSSSSKSATPIGAIVGGTIGGIALIVVTVLGILLLRSRHRGGRPYFYGAARTSDLLDQEVKDNETPPAMAPQLPPQLQHPVATQSSIQTPYTEPTPFMSMPSVAGGSAAHGAGSAPASSSRRKNEQGPTTAPAPAAFHEDSGVRFVAQTPQSEADARTEIPDDVPPQYTEH